MVSAVTSNNSAATITVADVPRSSEATSRIFGDLADSGLSVSMIARSTHAAANGRSSVVFTLPADGVPTALATLTALREQAGCGRAEVRDYMGRITISGVGMRSSAGVLRVFFRVLSAAAIPVLLVETSDLSISAVVPAGRLGEAVHDLEAAFGLGGTPEHLPALEHRDAVTVSGKADGFTHV